MPHCGRLRTAARALDGWREAFSVARAGRKPVVLSVPLDLQTEEFPYLPDYTPSTDLMPRTQVLRPDPAVVDEIVAMVAEAERPVVRDLDATVPKDLDIIVPGGHSFTFPITHLRR